MKVLVVSNMFPSKTYPTYGTFVKNFCDQISSIGVDFELCIMHKHSNKLYKIIDYLRFYCTGFFKTLFGKYDVIYIHYPSYSAVSVLMANRIKKNKLYINVHGSDAIPLTPNQERMEKYTRAALACAKKIVVPSLYFKKVISHKYYISKSVIYVYPSGGINANLFYLYSDDKRERLFKELGLNRKFYYVGFVSRIYRAKGWETFVNACKIISKYNKNIRFLIVGSGEDDSLLENKIRYENLNNYIVRYPALPQEKLADIYNIIDLFVFPSESKSESLGLVAIEAMACGCPVVASDYAAPGEYVIDGVNGYKFPLRESGKLASIILDCFAHTDDKKRLLRDGAIKTASEYCGENIKDRLRKIFYE